MIKKELLFFLIFPPFLAPHLFRECCWKVEERGAVGESAFHICFLMQTRVVTLTAVAPKFTDTF